MNKQEIEALKVDGAIYMNQKRFDLLCGQILETVEKLQNMSETYEHLWDIESLEKLKREYNSTLQYFGTLYANTKVYKGPNHTYLETAVKKLKSQTIGLIEETGKSMTAAEKLYVNHPHFEQWFPNINNLIKFFIEVEVKYERFSGTLQCIIQSVSVARGDFNNSKNE